MHGLVTLFLEVIVLALILLVVGLAVPHVLVIIRNGFMPHIMGHKLSHIYAREVR